MADIFEQVDDAMRQDRMSTLWRRYGWMLIAGAVLIVAGTAAIVGWRAYERGQEEEQTSALNAAMDAAAEAEPAQAVAALTAFADGANPNVAALARLRAAARAVEGDDAATAALLYQAVESDPEVDPVLRDLATVYGASLSVDSESFDALRGRLAALEAANSPWRHLVNEIMAAAAIRAGDLAMARERLIAISDDPEAPVGLRGRAAELLAAIGGGAEADAAPAEGEGSGDGVPASPAEDEGEGTGADDDPAAAGTDASGSGGSEGSGEPDEAGAAGEDAAADEPAEPVSPAEGEGSAAGDDDPADGGSDEATGAGE